MSKSVGIKIKTRLMELDMRQKELAKEAGLTESAVSRYISGRQSPILDNAIKIAKALKVDLNFFGGERND